MNISLFPADEQAIFVRNKAGLGLVMEDGWKYERYDLILSLYETECLAGNEQWNGNEQKRPVIRNTVLAEKNKSRIFRIVEPIVISDLYMPKAKNAGQRLHKRNLRHKW